MDLIKSLNSNGDIRGIALNSQEIDLFNLLDKDDNVNEIYNYLNGILQASKEDYIGMPLGKKISKVVDDKCKLENKDKFKLFLLKNAKVIAKNWDSRENLEKILLEGQHITPEYIDEILNTKKYFTYQTEGILSFLVDENGKTIDTTQDYNKILSQVDKEKVKNKVSALREYVTGTFEVDGNKMKRFNRLTLDSQGKFGKVAGLIDTAKESSATPEEYNLFALKEGYEFARKNGMDVRINALVFFKDFPDRLTGASKEQYKTALLQYGNAVATIVNEYKEMGIPTTIDMFNELVDYDEPFEIRTNKWMSKLSIEDLCEIAGELREKMPEANFGYNDWNFENSDKRKSQFEVLKRIQKYEQGHGITIIDHIGTQCHTSINDIEGLKKSIEELQVFGLPIDVTELDISKGLNGVDYEKATPEQRHAIKKYEQKLQNDAMKMLSDFVKEGKIRSITAWSVTDELCCGFCEGKEASVNQMSYSEEKGFCFAGKNMDIEIEMTEPEMQLISEHRQYVAEMNEKEINSNPIQDFAYHVHTQRCGHGAKDTGDKEFIQNAIKGGIKKVAFTDHIPMPEGLNKNPNMRMNISERDSYIRAIEHFRDEYKKRGIEIETGYEFEYAKKIGDTDYLNFLKEMKESSNKMVLGQHWVVDKKGNLQEIKRDEHGKQIGDDILQLYGDAICEAIDNNIPDIIAHPDSFMEARDSFGKKEQKIVDKICKKAIKAGIPLEINLGSIARYAGEENIEENKANTVIPSKQFWEYVSENYGDKLKVLFAKDAHYPEQLASEKDYEIAIDILGEDILEKLQFVGQDLESRNEQIYTAIKRIGEKNKTKDEFHANLESMVYDKSEQLENYDKLDEERNKNNRTVEPNEKKVNGQVL
ncbi:MAG: endo-1,4-beta-xylanase [Clostridia bacterium]|nr:endo-1,4-beta-xylanase [Clostridia bacterium]